MILVYLGVALGFSFLCSILEAVLLSITPAYVAGEEARGSPFGVRLLRGGERPGVLSREDIRNLIHAGHRRGIVRRDEKVIIDNLMNFGEVAVTDIMTPRDKIVALPSSTPIREVGPGSPAWLVSRIPIHGGDLAAIEGYVLKDEILARHVERRAAGTVAELRRELESVRDDLAMPALYQALVEASEHIAIVRDRDGRTVGLVTMENLFEAMLGVEIVDEEDHRRHGGD